MKDYDFQLSGLVTSSESARIAVRLQGASDFAADPEKLGGAGVVVVTVRDAPDRVVMRLRLVCQIEDLVD